MFKVGLSGGVCVRGSVRCGLKVVKCSVNVQVWWMCIRYVLGKCFLWKEWAWWGV